MDFSAGGVVVGPSKKIVVVSQNGNSWSLPKGHLDAGEDEQRAALREIEEETGITDARVVEKLGEYERGRIGLDGVGEVLDQMKHITMFLCVTDQLDLAPTDPANPEAKWLPIEEVMSWLTHEKDKDFFQSVKPRLYEYLAS